MAECRICGSLAAPDRPLRRPCACSGTIKFVHEDCQFRWLNFSGRHRCEVCDHEICIRLLYAGASSASELVARAAKPVLPLLYVAMAVQVVWASAVPLAALRTWRLALAGSWSCAEARSLFSVPLFGPSVLACSALWAEYMIRSRDWEYLPLWERVACILAYSAHLAEYVIRGRDEGGMPRCQRVALQVIRVSLLVFMGDTALAFIFAFTPFTLGRIILLCIDEGDYYASTTSILLTGYGFIFSLGTAFAGMYTFRQYLRGECLDIVTFFGSLPGIIKLRAVANILINIINTAIVCPLLYAWSLDICTSKIFGTTMPVRFRHLFASSYSSISLHWIIGCALWDLGSTFSRLHSTLFRPGVHHNVNLHEPFHKFYFKRLPDLFVEIILISMAVLVPIEIAGRLAPELFPVDITYFGSSTKGTSLWLALANYTDSLCGVLLLRLLIGHTNTIIFLEWLVKKVTQCPVHTGHTLGLSASVTVCPNRASGHDAGSSVTPKDKHSSTKDAKDERRSVAVHTIVSVVLAWLTFVTFNLAVLIFPISIGRALLIAITQLPLAGGLKYNDLLALVVGFGIISTIIPASRGSFVYMTSGRTRPLTLNRSVIVFLWFVIVPIMIGLLVDLSLISPFIGPDGDVPVLDLLRTWFLGWLLLKIWVKWVHWPLTPFLVYLTVKSRGPRLTRAKVDWPRGVIPLHWFLRDIFVPIATRLLAALGVPYILAKGVFPRFGCSAAANSVAYRLAWLAGIGFCVFCHLAKLFCIEMHDSIRGDPIGQRLEDITSDL